MNRPLAIVVLNWNGSEDTLKCIDSLLCQSYEPITIIVVDNGSTDPDTELLINKVREKSPTIKIIRNKLNLGFTGGVNTGINYALEHNFELIALLNNDAIADKDWAHSLVKSHNEQKSGITTGLLLHEDGETIDSTGDFYTTWGIPFPRHRNEPTENSPDSGYVFSASGGASLYSAKMLKEIGLFDEDFFAYYEDTDISFRAQLRGYKVYFTKEAKAYHKQGASSAKVSGFTTVQTFKNLPLLMIKNVPLSLLPATSIKFYLIYLLLFINSVLNGRGTYAAKGFISHIPIFWRKLLKDRVKIQRNKNVSADYIRSISWKGLPVQYTNKIRKK